MDGGKYDIKPAQKKKKVAVIGGGVGGMEVARIATLRGHNVTIYEKTDRLGGVFIPAGAMSFKSQDRKLLDWYRRQIDKLNIEVKYNTEITDISKLDADEIVIATGAVAKKLNIKGIENAIEAIDFLNKTKLVGENVAIIGGGLTGCEIAYELSLNKKKPIIIEAKQDLMAVRGLCLANSSYLRDYFKHNNVPVYLQSSVKEITQNSIVIVDKDGVEHTEQIDNVISCVGYNPNPIAKAGKHIHIVGDALKVGNLRTVVWRAWEVAEKI